METKNYSISELELDPIQAEEIISHCIDSKINMYRIRAIQDWEKNHTKKNYWDAQIEKLIRFKHRWNDEFKIYKQQSGPIKVVFSVELNPTAQRSQDSASHNSSKADIKNFAIDENTMRFS